MSYLSSTEAFALAAALMMTMGGAQAAEGAKYPDWRGQWSRILMVVQKRTHGRRAVDCVALFPVRVEVGMKIACKLLVIAAALASNSAFAQYTDGTVKIGVLTDMSSIYSDITGLGSVVAAKLAVEDFGAAAKGMKVEIIGGDMQNKTDVGVNIATSWFDVEKVDVIVDVPNSAIGLAVSDIARRKNKLFLAIGTATSDLTGTKCNANTIHWLYDTWALANGTGNATVKAGGDTWFFLTADYAFGYAMERDTTAVVEANGGKVVGKVRAPLNTNDFSSFLLQAQASRAKVIGLANGGGDAINAIKQAAAFGIVEGGQRTRRNGRVAERCCRARPADCSRSHFDRGLVLGHER